MSRSEGKHEWKDVRRSGRTLAFGLGVLLGLALAAGLAMPARASECKGVPEPDQKKIDRLRDSGQFDALERMLATYERAYHADPYCEPPLWDALGDDRVPKESDRRGFDAWVTARPRSWAALTARGIFWEQIGYQRRGETSWSKTPPDRQKGFEDAMQRAEKDLRQAIALEPRDVVAAGVLLEVLKGYGDTKGALAVYHAALAADPMTKGVRVRMLWAAEPEWGGSVALMKQVVAEARAHEEANPRLKEVEPFYYSWAGYRFCVEGKYAEAVRAYRKALSLMPDQPRWEHWLAWALQRKGDEAGALHEATKAVAGEPDYAAGWILRSTIYRKLGDGAAALADSEKAVQLEPRNADAWSARASANVALSQWQPAEEAYAKVAALSDDGDTQVWALEQRSKLVSAHAAGGGSGAPATAVEGVVQHLIAETESSKATTAKHGNAAQEPPLASGSQASPSPASPQP